MKLDMLVVVSYDIQNDRKRTRLAKRLRDFGPRVQKSVFEADISQEELNRLHDYLSSVRLKENESIRFYRICADCVKSVRIWGSGKITEDQDLYIV